MFHRSISISVALLGLMACSEPPPALTTLHPILDVRPSPIAALGPALGLSSETPILLRSVGSAALEIRNLALEAPASLSLPARAFPLVLAPLEEVTVNLGFRPTSIDGVSGNLVIYSNNTDNPELRIPITASARSGKVLLVCVASADAHVDESCSDRDVSLDLGEVGVGGRRAALVRLKSVGSERVTVAGLGLDANSAEGYSVAELSGPVELLPGQTYETMVLYAPPAEGRRSATLVVEGDDGAAHRVGLLATGGARALCLSPSRIDFGTLAVGAVVTSTVEVEACGGRAVLVTAAEISAGNPDFRLAQPFGRAVSLMAGARLALPVTYSPTSTGAAEATLAVQSDAGQATMTLAGASETCLAEVGPNLLTFAPGGGTQAMTLRAQGTCAVVLERIDIAPTSDQGFSVVSPTLPASVTSGVIRMVLRYSGILAPSAAQGTALVTYVAGGVRQTVPVTLTAPDAIDHLQCVGMSNARWRDDWPAAPAPVRPAATLRRNTGTMGLATCPEPAQLLVGSAAMPTPPESPTPYFDSYSSHIGGKYYFEATQLALEGSNWPGPGVYAWPASPWTDSTSGELQAAVHYREPDTTLGVIGVAADLDAGRVYFYKNGAQVGHQDLLMLPGVGSYHVGTMLYGAEIYRFNLGAQPFAYQVPSGYLAWATGPVDETGNCARLAEAGPMYPAPIEVIPPAASSTSGIETRARHPIQLIHLTGAGTTTTSYWVLDADGQPQRAQRPGAATGSSVLIEVNRPGRVLLTLFNYSATDWVVIAGPATELIGVVAYGYDPHTVLAPGVTTQTYSLARGDSFPLEPPWGWWPSDTTFLDYLEVTYCLPLRIAVAAPGDRVIIR